MLTHAWHPEQIPSSPLAAWHWAYPERVQPPAAVLAEERRYQAARGAWWAGPSEAFDLAAELEAELEGYWERYAAEQALAEAMERAGLTDIAAEMRKCHRSGAVAVTADGRRVIAWDHKCGRVRVCPHEARAETQRLAAYYVPAVLEWLEAKPGRRVQFGVLTLKNPEPGRLAYEKRRAFERFKRWMRAHPVIAGALVCQEDPLSARDDWNLHLNVLLLLCGPFDWNAAGEAWGCRAHFQRVRPRADGLARALLELVKYSAKHTAKLDRAEGGPVAPEGPPAMDEWPPERLREWWAAQQGFRRTRAYGCLYALDRKRWDAWDEAKRESLRWHAAHWERLPLEIVSLSWRELTDRQRDVLRRALREPEPPSPCDPIWIGTVEADDAWGCYVVRIRPGAPDGVSLIPGDKSPAGSVGGWHKGGAPPPYH